MYEVDVYIILCAMSCMCVCIGPSRNRGLDGVCQVRDVPPPSIPPLQEVSALCTEDGPPLPLDQQLHRRA